MSCYCDLSEADCIAAGHPVAAPRLGDWIQTYTGRQFWPLDPRADEIHLLDVAAGIARDCRFGGQTRLFYSVAEHSVLIARHLMREGAPARVCRAGLFHDAPEGLGPRDMPRPLKNHMPEYKRVEGGILVECGKRFAFDVPLPRVVKTLDERIGRTEQMQLMMPPPAPWSPAFEATEPLPVKLECWSPDDAMQEFVNTARELGAF